MTIVETAVTMRITKRISWQAIADLLDVPMKKLKRCVKRTFPERQDLFIQVGCKVGARRPLKNIDAQFWKLYNAHKTMSQAEIAQALGVSARTLTKRYGLIISKRDWYERTPSDKLLRMRVDKRHER